MQRTIRKSALALAAGNGHAQSTTGSIVGSVPPGAGESSVLITNTSGFSREVKVDERGRYAQGNLPLGTYTVTLKRDGQVVETRENISLVQKIARANGGSNFEFAKDAREQKLLWSARKESLWSMLSLRKEGEEVCE
jgi:hypothetical protein